MRSCCCLYTPLSSGLAGLLAKSKPPALLRSLSSAGAHPVTVCVRMLCLPGPHASVSDWLLTRACERAARSPLTAAVAAAGRGTFVLDGVARMRERPIQDLVDGMVQLGVQARCTLGTGCPPVEVQAEGLPSGTVRFSA